MSRLLALLLLAAPAAAQPYLTADADSVRVGEPFTLSLVVPHSMYETVVWPEAGRAWAGSGIEVLERVSVDSSYGGTAAPGTRVDSAAYRVAAFGLDTLAIGPVGVRLVRGADTAVVPSRVLRLPLVHVLPDSAEIVPARDVRRIGYPSWVWAAGAAILAALALLAWWLWRRRREDAHEEPVPAVPPHERALSRLREAEAYDLTDPAQIKPFYVAVTDAVRAYLHERAGVQALEETSAEVVGDARAASRDGRLPQSAPALLADVFAVADYAKYARGRPAPARGADVLEASRALVERTEAHLRAAEEAARAEEERAAAADEPNAAPPIQLPPRPTPPRPTPPRAGRPGPSEPPSYAPPGLAEPPAAEADPPAGEPPEGDPSPQSDAPPPLPAPQRPPPLPRRPEASRSYTPKPLLSPPDSAQAEPEPRVRAEGAGAASEAPRAEPETVRAQPEPPRVESQSVRDAPGRARGQSKTLRDEPDRTREQPEAGRAKPEAARGEPETTRDADLASEASTPPRAQSEASPERPSPGAPETPPQPRSSPPPPRSPYAPPSADADDRPA